MDQPRLYVLQLSALPRRPRLGRAIGGLFWQLAGSVLMALLAAAVVLWGLG